MGRYSMIICQYFKYAGYNIIIKTNKKYFKIINRYKKPLLEKHYSFIRSCSTPLNSIVLVKPNGDSHTIHLKYGYELAKTSGNDCQAPYPMHPNFYEAHPSADTFESLRKASRTIQVFFAGNSNIKSYKKESLKRTFNVIPRYNVLKFIREEFDSTGLLEVVNDKSVFYNILESDTTRKNILISNVRAKSSDWLKTLSKSSFFLCPPGALMPWSHNLVEAMSVGTIPILQYGNLMEPALVHKQNCLSYSNFEELQKAIETALTMDMDSVNRMRGNVIEYFEKYLSLQTVIAKINDLSNSGISSTNVVIPYIPK
jgi:hypothetical protein